MNSNFINMLIKSGLTKEAASSVSKIVDSEFKSRIQDVDKRLTEGFKSKLKKIDDRLYSSLKEDLVVLLTSLDEQYQANLKEELDKKDRQYKKEFKEFITRLDETLEKKYGHLNEYESNGKILAVDKETPKDDIEDFVKAGYKVELPEEEDIILDDEVMLKEDSDEGSEEEYLDDITDLEVAKELLAQAEKEIETLRAEVDELKGSTDIDSEESAFDDFDDFDDFEDYATSSGYEGEDGDLDFLWEKRAIIKTKEQLDRILKESTKKYKEKKKKALTEQKALYESKKTKKHISITDVEKNRKNVSTLLESSFKKQIDTNSISDIYIPTKYL